jgi:branched-chain amino acid transport system substrate-binding protein
MYRKALVPLTALAVSAMLVSACGGSDGGGTGTGKTLKIAVSTPLSGPAAGAGTGILCGVKAYFDQANKRGGVGGYTFQVQEKDNQFDPAVSAQVARDLAGTDVFGVVIAGSAPLTASRAALKARQIPTFATADGSVFVPPKWPGEYGFYPEYTREAASAASFIHTDLREEKASLVYVGNATGEPASKGFPPAFQAAGGTVALSEAVPVQTTDFTPIAQKLKQAGAPIVYASVLDTQLAGLQKAAAAIGYSPKWVAWGVVWGPTYLKLAGALAQGLYVSQWSLPETQKSDPAVAEYRTAVGAACPGRLGDNGVKSGYAQAAMIAYGVKQLVDKGRPVTREQFIDTYAFEDKQIGLTPGLTISKDDHAPIGANSYWQVASVKGDLKMIRDFTPLPAAPGN